MLKSDYHISKMDCPSEENMIREKLDGIPGLGKLDFDLYARRLPVSHSASGNEVQSKLLNSTTC